jgi:tRNA(Ile2)-agmatinylcytidine synthase
MKCFIGIDDTDSSLGFCTTFLGYKIVGKLLQEGCGISSYPKLVRLNPNIPFKTRGNAAVSIAFDCYDVKTIFEEICSLIEIYSDQSNGANSGLVFLEDESSLSHFKSIYRIALSGIVNKARIARMLLERRIRTFTLGNGMGIVGASASLGFDESDDHTYELLSYRKLERCGTPRNVSRASVKRMEAATFSHTFNNYDHESERVLITPHGPDPVFLGIRGDSPYIVHKAFRMIEHGEVLEGYVIYSTNQCTDAHLNNDLALPLKPYSSGRLAGVVKKVQTGIGGHLYFSLDVQSKEARCSIYEPTGDMNRVSRLLALGDRVIVAGGVRRPSSKHPSQINVERLGVIELANLTDVNNPICGLCSSRMKSEGKFKGFQCKRCGRRLPEGSECLKRIDRILHSGIYLPSPRAQRHLTKPLVRYGRELTGLSYPLIEGWFSISTVTPLQKSYSYH